MTTMLNDFGAFMDSLRKSRNMSREEFIDGIISLRQYQRYVNGESSLNNDKLFRLIDKLGMNYFNVHKIYFSKNTDEIAKINKVYGEISRGNLSLASDLLKNISNNNFYNEYSKSYYRLCELLILMKSKKMPKTLVISNLKILIDYPSCLKNEIINFVEYVAYIHISGYSSESNDDVKILNLLFDKIKSDSISADSMIFEYIPSTFALISRRLGVLGEYSKSLSVSQKGIDWCLRHEIHNSLSHLLMYKSLSLKDLDKKEEALLVAKKLFALLYVEDKIHKTKKFTEIFEKAFNMKVSEL